MSILVVNCSHWIGFHITEALLGAGNTVEGIPFDEETDDLLMFFGRNSSFTLSSNIRKKKYDICIIIGEYDHRAIINADKIVIINEQKHDENRDSSTTTIKAPLLYGEWMPMNEKGCYVGEEYITFESDYFKQNAIYIKDFTEGLIQWLDSGVLPATFEVKSYNNNEKLDNIFYIRNNKPVDKKVKKLLEHYHSYKNSYK
ncbi:hypothetical protein [Oceanobacillus bengalensis]|uniref:Uncharacterized protein n=1 Tax=Oceanobacillus bengalensis TaxID=1435466 RepID=A0A494Z8B4_9BACI|nr:hypothetical protein [Oceanobacillus bengalensis]RKQ18852.1 hypothetical protein D8M05_01720 [Oceanobacillus bengalensis]